MKLIGMTAALLALALASCEKPTAENREPASGPPVATPPPVRQFAAPGNYFLRRAVSVVTDSGVAGFPPGTAVRQTAKGKYRTADGRTLTLKASDVTNDIGEARTLAGRDAAVQAALARVPVSAPATTVVVASKPLVEQALPPVVASAAPPAKAATLGVPIGSASPLNRGAYGRTEAFVDTDGDGRKFDTNQRSRVR